MMGNKRRLSAEERLEELRERLAPTLASIGIQIHRDGERMKAAQAHRRGDGPKAA